MPGYRRLDLKIGFLCNNSCLHCVQGNKRAIFGNKPLEVLKKEMRRARRSCDAIVFTGGEPTLHKDFLKAVRYALGLGYKAIQVQTNGRLFFYKDFCSEAIRSGADDFCLALLG
ncbi:MAG: radical SAM protein, partial [Candidatus Omnitrophota bacterium]|nr:radical SAM protein [Candidatus Omnitrophota bacterium]